MERVRRNAMVANTTTKLSKATLPLGTPGNFKTRFKAYLKIVFEEVRHSKPGETPKPLSTIAKKDDNHEGGSIRLPETSQPLEEIQSSN